MVLTYRKEVIRQGKKKEWDCWTHTSVDHSFQIRPGVPHPIAWGEHVLSWHHQQDQLPTCDLEILINQLITFFPSWLSSNCACNWVQVIRDVRWIWIGIACQDIINLDEIWSYTSSVIFSQTKTVRTSQSPDRAPRTLPLQYAWAASHVKLSVAW